MKVSLKAIFFIDADDMIPHIYYLNKKSTRKLRWLKELVILYEDTRFYQGSLYPRKATGNTSDYLNLYIPGSQSVLSLLQIERREASSLQKNKGLGNEDEMLLV